MWRLRRDRGLRSQLFWHSLSHIRRFSPLRMTKRGNARRSVDRRFSSYRQPSPRGEGAPKGRIGHRRDEREWERASQVRCLREHPIHRSASIYIKSEARLRIILAPSSGRGRRAKRGGVGIPACENAASRANLRPFGAPPSKGRREKRGVC